MKNTNRISVPRIPWKETDAANPEPSSRDDTTQHTNDIHPHQQRLATSVPSWQQTAGVGVRPPRVAQPKPSGLQQAIKQSKPFVSAGKPTLAIDFDGVIWDKEMPMLGATAALRRLKDDYRLVCFTARPNLAVVRQVLEDLDLFHHFAEVTNRKPRAVIYLDDKALKFTTWTQALEDLT